MKQKKIIRASAVFLVSAFVLANISTVQADELNTFNSPSSYKVVKNNNSYQKRSLKDSYIVYGSGTLQKNKKAVTDSLNQDDILNDANKSVVNANDVYKILGIPDLSDTNVHSSVSLAPAKQGTGVLVNVVPFKGHNNITMITAQQYALAAQLSGVTDVVITVTADQPIGGQGALAGLYLALQQDNINISQQNIIAANQVIQATQAPVIQNAKDVDYSGQLNSAIANTAKTISISSNIQNGDIQNELKNNLQKNGILKQTDANSQKQIATALNLVNQTKYAHTNTFKRSMSQANKTLQSSQTNTMAQLSDYQDATFKQKAIGYYNKAKAWVLAHLGQNKPVIKKFSNNVAKLQSSNGSDTNINYSTGQANSSELLKMFDDWDGTKEGSIMKVNGGKATFTPAELSQKFQLKGKATELNPSNGLQLSQLDNLGRSQVANAYITKESMSGTEQRIPIPATSAPSGWYNNAKYNNVNHRWQGGTPNNKKINGSYIYNKSHLIGWQFFDNNKAPNNVNGVMSTQNLVTGTRVQNADPGQLRYENQIAKAVQQGHNVRLQVTPIYSGTELVPRMTHYVAESVDDHGQAININVVILNVQPGVKINYNTGVATPK